MATSSDWSEEQLEAAAWAKELDWGIRTRPEEFDPVQLKSDEPVTLSWIDWWNTRSNLFCCFFPFLRCMTGGPCNPCAVSVIESTDPSVWKEQLKRDAPGIPEPFRGVWWLKYNHAPEELVTIFSDAEFVGTFNEDFTDGVGTWNRPLRWNWTRENNCFGHGFAFRAHRPESKVIGRVNFKAGMLTVSDADKTDGRQWVYRVSDNEWWKVHYEGKPGTEGEQKVTFMYKWLKVIDKDGTPTEHWEDFVDRVEMPLPHRGCCLSPPEIKENMTYPSRKQIVEFKKHA